MSKNLTENYPIVDTVEALEERLAGVREAQRIFAAYTQEQVDKIFTAAALAANKARIPLAKLAVEETGMGIVEDKVIKNHYASEYIYNAYRDTKTCGVIEEDKAYGIKKVAEPIGVVAAVIPTTNPTSTAIFKTLISLKTRNGIIISPHPRAKKSTIAAAKVVLEAAVAAGAPEGIIGWIDVPSLELTDTLMKEADIILATGGPGMVKAAYSSGKPALGVGAGKVDLSTQDKAKTATTTIDAAIKKVSKARGQMGAVQNRLEHTINNLDTASENLQTAESRIRDTDMAEEMVNYSKNNILAQAGQSMLAQANQSNQGVLTLLQ